MYTDSYIHICKYIYNIFIYPYYIYICVCVPDTNRHAHTEIWFRKERDEIRYGDEDVYALMKPKWPYEIGRHTCWQGELANMIHIAVQRTLKTYQGWQLVKSFKLLCRYTVGRLQLLPMTSLASLASVVMPCAGPLLLVLNLSKFVSCKLESSQKWILCKINYRKLNLAKLTHINEIREMLLPPRSKLNTTCEWRQMNNFGLTG